MAATRSAGSMRKTGIVPNSIGQKLLPAIASRRLCILMVMCATLKSGFRGWQPACTIKEEVLAKYFASQADKNIRRRRQCRVEARAQKWTGLRPRRAKTFLAPWHSAQPREKSTCGTHKEGRKDAHAAARTAGFLFAVTESGLLLDVMELIGAESLSQRFHFAAQCAHRLPSLTCIVHDMTAAT